MPTSLQAYKNYIISIWVKTKKLTLSNDFSSFKRHRFFTLAEVLITLTIIGVISAMSVPALLMNINKQDYVTGLKKFHSVASQALIQMAADKGCIGDLKCTSLFGPYGSVLFIQ